MLNPNAEPYQMIHIMSPSSYYYHKETLPPPPPPPPALQLIHPFNPKPILPFPHELFNPIYSRKPSLCTNSKHTSRPSSLIPFGSVTRFVPRQHQVKMIGDNHGSSDNKYSNHDTSSGTGVYLCHPIPKRPSSANKKTTTKTSPNISTSVMMRNIPNNLSRRMLISILDQHCIDENRKALRMLYQDDHQVPSESTTLSEYDFLYLPIDFKRKGNKGYAFLNFTTPVAAMRFYNAFNNLSWKDSIYESSKVCKICSARIQGKDELVKRFKNSYFDCDTDEFLPVSFSPPRNGSTPDSFPSLVGKRPKTTRK